MTDISMNCKGITRPRSIQKLFLILFSAVFLAAVSPALSSDAEAAGKKCHATAKHKCSSKHRKHAFNAHPTPASFVVDADTGKIFESENADSLRYPASLTKMMTLYLTFEALDKGKLRLDQTIPVSQHASEQPQTNIALQPGDRIAVKDAILSIVVRSANDSAVALGEALGGGSEETFAHKMTEKAHALGMSNTVFFNASGLPEPRQHTTARDMATLGLALRKNYPQYFPFFKTESFTYNGITYPTHNHVMTRYEGVDGIKTGYIRASGFNLVTSAKRDDHTLIGVVLGGSTWKARDDKMIALLDRNFARLESQNVSVADASKKSPRPVITPPEESSGDEEVASNEQEQAQGEGDLTEEDKEPVASKALADASGSHNWGVQVGAYARKSDAVNAASRAMKTAAKTLGASKIAVNDRKGHFYRARLVNLTQADAESTCKLLAGKDMSCMVIKN